MSLRVALALLLVALTGCPDREKDWIASATPILDRALPMVERDTAQVRKGLPEGAKVIANHIDEDPGADPAGLQRAISKARAAVHDLVVAKSTFFVFVGKDGTMLRSEADPDIAAGESLLKGIPDAKKLLDPKAGMVELWGYANGLRGVNEGGDLQWVVGHPVVESKGELRGAFITGWSLRKYAEYLENDARLVVAKQSEEAKAIPPLLYIFVVKANVAYGGPQTPDINTQAVTNLALSDKTKPGSFSSGVEVEQRRFAVIAKPTPPLGDDAALAVMWSVF